MVDGEFPQADRYIDQLKDRLAAVEGDRKLLRRVLAEIATLDAGVFLDKESIVNLLKPWCEDVLRLTEDK